MGVHKTCEVDVTNRSDDIAVLLRSRTEPECFAVLFERYFAGLHGYSARRLDGAGGDDVAAETFLVAFRQRVRCSTTRPWYRPGGPTMPPKVADVRSEDAFEPDTC